MALVAAVTGSHLSQPFLPAFRIFGLPRSRRTQSSITTLAGFQRGRSRAIERLERFDDLYYSNSSST